MHNFCIKPGQECNRWKNMPYHAIVHQGYFAEVNTIANSFNPTAYYRDSGYITIK